MISSVEHQSGSAMRFRGLAGALVRRGHEVSLVEPAPPGAELETPEGVRRLPCPRLPGRPEWQAPLWLAHGLAATRSVRPDVCWALKALPNAWIPARAARRGGARIAVDLDDLDFAYYAPGPVRSLVQRFFDEATRTADDVTVHTETMRERVAAARPGRSEPVFVDQGVDPARFAAVPESPELRARLGLGPGPVLLYAGHLGPASDLGTLFPAVARVARDRPDARLLVVGDGRSRRALESRAGRELPPGFARFVGAVRPANVPVYYRLANVALNYLEDNEANRHRASIKLREALAAGLPVVTSPTPDARRFSDFVRFPEAPGAEPFAHAILAELAEPSVERARAGAVWIGKHGTHDEAVRGIAERWERLG